MIIEQYTFRDYKFNIVRDDLFPHFYGGNKARKMEYIKPFLLAEKYDSIITTGGIQSNHCRVVALFSAKYNFKCKLILHGSKKDFYNQNGNALLMRMSGCEFEFVAPHEISTAMDNAMEDFRARGYKPYYYYGGGHNEYGVMAYIEAVKELRHIIDEPDYIFLASGTGSTQAGIILGLREMGWLSTKVHGISVSRNEERGRNGILEAIKFIDKYYDNEIWFHDNYIMGGYGIKSNEVEKFTLEVASQIGLILDNTYTGKALYGMLSYIHQNELKGKFLFWNTGGLINRLS